MQWSRLSSRLLRRLAPALYARTGEDGTTNLLLRSQEFDNASWGKTRSTVTANATTAPDGTLTADAVNDDLSAGSHTISQACGVAVGQPVTVSCHFKAGTLPAAFLFFSAAAMASFDLTTGSVGFSNGVTARTEKLPNGWWRCSIYAPATTAAAVLIGGQTATGSAISYQGDTTHNFYVWGAQSEAGKARPSSYLATVGAAVTRLASSIAGNGRGFSIADRLEYFP